MIWKSIVRPRAIAPRRRYVASALVYGLSLGVRFTSAAGEEVEIPAHSVQRTKPLMSIMTGAGPRLPYEDWAPNSAQPIVFRSGWPPGSPGCRAGM